MMRSLPAFAALLLAACDDARPCSSCPPIEGRYQMRYEAEQLSQGCASLESGPPPPELVLTRVGSTLRSQAGSVELAGTVFDTFDFTLGGSQVLLDGGSDAIDVRGVFIPPSGVTDGGTWLRGHYATQQTRPGLGGSQSCTRQHSFLGEKQ